jgi:hypothetical protein
MAAKFMNGHRGGYILLEWVLVIGLLAFVWPGLSGSLRGAYESVGHWVETIMRHYDNDYWQDQIRQDVNQASALERRDGWLTVSHPDEPLIQYDIRQSCLRRRLYRNHRWYSYTLVCGVSDWTVSIFSEYIRIEYRYLDDVKPVQPLIIGYACAAV